MMGWQLIDRTVHTEATERVRSIVKGLLDFSRQAKLEVEPSDVIRLMRDPLALVENQALVKSGRADYHLRRFECLDRSGGRDRNHCDTSTRPDATPR